MPAWKYAKCEKSIKVNGCQFFRIREVAKIGLRGGAQNQSNL